MGWVYINVKNPGLFIDLVKLLPNARFVMVGGKTGNHELYEVIMRASEKFPNFSYSGFVPFHKIDDYFKKASILVNTSSVEGFPNTFIQAWANHVPVVSLNVDPDGIIESGRLGFCSGNFEQMVCDVATLLSDQDLRKVMGENGRKYVEREHDIRKIVDIYSGVFKSLS